MPQPPFSRELPAPAPRALVADDDPASRRFLGDGLRRVGADVETREDGTAALARARCARFDLLLLDCRMPGAGALDVLDALRADPDAASRGSPAVATSAECDVRERRRLLDAGFAAVLVKPCDLQALRRVMTLARGDGQARVLDDAAALAGSGDARTMQALRGLLRGELAALDAELEPLACDRPAFAERLHRLRSSCGFCGATSLGTSAAALQRHLRTMPAEAQLPLEPFRASLRETLHALAARQA